MKARWLVVPAVLAAIILMLAQSCGLSGIITSGLGATSVTTCGSGPAVAASVAVGPVPEVSGYGADQIRNAVTIDQVRRQLGLPPRATQIAYMTAMVEGPNLLNPHSGDRDSQGMFQQRPSTGWGTPDQVTDPVLATRAFFGMAAHTRNPGLSDIPAWQTRPMGEVSQAVQRSAYPERYQTRAADAADLMQRIGTDNAATGDAAPGLITPTECIDATAVLSTAGKNGGGAPFTGTCTVDKDLPRRNPTSCADAIAKARAMTKQSCSWYKYCLGFTARAYGWNAGSGEYSAWTHWQNLDRLAYTHRGDRNPPPGALVFWKGSGAYGHIAITVGGGKIASNDIRRSGCIDIVDWDAPETQWGQRYLGWAPPYYPKGG